MQAWLIVADTFPGFISKVTTNLKQQTKSPAEILKTATSRILPTCFTRSPNRNDDENNTLHIIQSVLQLKQFKLIF
jgi:hypothetical protein